MFVLSRSKFVSVFLITLAPLWRQKVYLKLFFFALLGIHDCRAFKEQALGCFGFALQVE